jgi:signal transduction histidine kinase
LAEPANLYQCADDAIHLLSLEKSSLARNIANRIDPDHNVRGDSQGVLQVFINLLKNAMDACKPVTEREAVITLTSIDHGQTIEIRITDNGPGIPEGMQEKVFDPFFTTKEPGQGTGLGLSLVYSIIEEHSGQIHVVSPPARNLAYGTCFIIQLPKHATA